MDPESPVVALLSIKPRYATAILEGRKKVEFRKRKFAREVSHIVIYATAPIMRVVGWFKTGQTHQLSPESLWRRFSNVGGITREDFFAYYAGVRDGVGIAVKAVKQIRKPLALKRVTSSPPPQGYTYLPASILSFIERVDTRLPAKCLRVKRKAAKAKSAKSATRKTKSRL
jgi:predicted transcriptional regulator